MFVYLQQLGYKCYLHTPAVNPQTNFNRVPSDKVPSELKIVSTNMLCAVQKLAVEMPEVTIHKLSTARAIQQEGRLVSHHDF